MKNTGGCGLATGDDGRLTLELCVAAGAGQRRGRLGSCEDCHPRPERPCIRCVLAGRLEEGPSSKLIDQDYRSCRENVCFFGFLERTEGSDIKSFLQNMLPTLTGLTFDPPMEFQRVHHLGPSRQDGASRPPNHCLSPGPLLLVAHSHGSFRTERYKVRIATDFSKVTNNCRKAFLSMRPLLSQLDVKNSLFQSAQMWITKNGKSKDFYEPEDLRLFLDNLLAQVMDRTSLDWLLGQTTDPQGILPSHALPEG
ncbi:hypothetical protein NDU88_008154 [Pleurodeles waltl]|uniref:Uncharacterized protein n=1 Tax=Pleurodeles waltl TaxID=8319 RepID=A0AAV7RSY8_PLEWA|nr:hypothetical protein NDU88_008154 [Pleurodeles waltl]